MEYRCLAKPKSPMAKTGTRMKLEIIATVQAKLLLYKSEAEILRNALIEYAPRDDVEFQVIQGVIDELKKVKDFKGMK